MSYKWIGAVLIIAACGGMGFLFAASHRKEVASQRQLIAALDYMGCELQYRLTPLPELCRRAGKECRGCVSNVFSLLARELEYQASPDVAGCMAVALQLSADVPQKTRENLCLLGNSLGRFDLEGQLKGLAAVRTACRRDLEALSCNAEQRLRGYQTLWLCAGAALAILLI